MKSQGAKHLNIGLDTIFLAEGKYKTYIPDILKPASGDNLARHINRRKSYVAPELLRNPLGGDIPPKLSEIDAYLADVYSLGLALLEACTLRIEQSFLARDKTVNRELIQNKLADMSGSYSAGFMEMLIRMISIDPKNRVTPEQLVDLTTMETATLPPLPPQFAKFQFKQIPEEGRTEGDVERKGIATGISHVKPPSVGLGGSGIRNGSAQRPFESANRLNRGPSHSRREMSPLPTNLPARPGIENSIPRNQGSQSRQRIAGSPLMRSYGAREESQTKIIRADSSQNLPVSVNLAQTFNQISQPTLQQTSSLTSSQVHSGHHSFISQTQPPLQQLQISFSPQVPMQEMPPHPVQIFHTVPITEGVSQPPLQPIQVQAAPVFVPAPMPMTVIPSMPTQPPVVTQVIERKPSVTHTIERPPVPNVFIPARPVPTFIPDLSKGIPIREPSPAPVGPRVVKTSVRQSQEHILTERSEISREPQRPVNVVHRVSGVSQLPPALPTPKLSTSTIRPEDTGAYPRSDSIPRLIYNGIPEHRRSSVSNSTILSSSIHQIAPQPASQSALPPLPTQIIRRPPSVTRIETQSPIVQSHSPAVITTSIPPQPTIVHQAQPISIRSSSPVPSRIIRQYTPQPQSQQHIVQPAPQISSFEQSGQKSQQLNHSFGQQLSSPNYPPQQTQTFEPPAVQPSIQKPQQLPEHLSQHNLIHHTKTEQVVTFQPTIVSQQPYQPQHQNVQSHYQPSSNVQHYSQTQQTYQPIFQQHNFVESSKAQPATQEPQTYTQLSESQPRFYQEKAQPAQEPPFREQPSQPAQFQPAHDPPSHQWHQPAQVHQPAPIQPAAPQQPQPAPTQPAPQPQHQQQQPTPTLTTPTSPFPRLIGRTYSKDSQGFTIQHLTWLDMNGIRRVEKRTALDPSGNLFGKFKETGVDLNDVLHPDPLEIKRVMDEHVAKIIEERRASEPNVSVVSHSEVRIEQEVPVVEHKNNKPIEDHDHRKVERRDLSPEQNRQDLEEEEVQEEQQTPQNEAVNQISVEPLETRVQDDQQAQATPTKTPPRSAAKTNVPAPPTSLLHSAKGKTMKVRYQVHNGRNYPVGVTGDNLTEEEKHWLLMRVLDKEGLTFEDIASLSVAPSEEVSDKYPSEPSRPSVVAPEELPSSPVKQSKPANLIKDIQNQVIREQDEENVTQSSHNPSQRLVEHIDPSQEMFFRTREEKVLEEIPAFRNIDLSKSVNKQAAVIKANYESNDSSAAPAHTKFDYAGNKGYSAYDSNYDSENIQPNPSPNKADPLYDASDIDALLKHNENLLSKIKMDMKNIGENFASGQESARAANKAFQGLNSHTGKSRFADYDSKDGVDRSPIGLQEFESFKTKNNDVNKL